MSTLGEKRERTAVPQFGGWEQHNAGKTNYNYSREFSQVRAKKRRSKSEGPYLELTPCHAQPPSSAPSTPVFGAPPPSVFLPPVSPNKNINNNNSPRRFFGCCFKS